MSRTFKCAACHVEFESEWTDAEAEAEYADVFGTTDEPREVVCDDCYRRMIEAMPPVRKTR